MALAAPSTLAWAASSDIPHTDLGDGAAVFVSGGTNVLVVPAGDGLIMVDGGPAKDAKALLAAIDRMSGKKPIQYLFNTCWDYDHSGANELVRARGAEIVAHVNTKLWLGGDFYSRWQDHRYRPRPAEALPTKTFYDGGKMTVGDQTLTYANLFQAHTDGDIYVDFQPRNILAAGELVSGEGYPQLDYVTGGWIGGMLKANEALLKIANDDTMVIPGRGPVKGKADIKAQHDMLKVVFDRMKTMAQKGLSGEEMLKAGITKEFDKTWGDPTRFVLNAYQGFANHSYDVGGFI